MRFFGLFCFLFFSFQSFSIYNLKTNKGAQPKDVNKKYWLLVAQGCHSCSEVLKNLTTFCSGKKPSPSRVGFFATGSQPSRLLKKLDDFKADYEIFSGSPNEFYETYNISGSPSLKAKNKTILGKNKILKFLKKDSHFCTT